MSFDEQSNYIEFDNGMPFYRDSFYVVFFLSGVFLL